MSIFFPATTFSVRLTVASSPLYTAFSVTVPGCAVDWTVTVPVALFMLTPVYGVTMEYAMLALGIAWLYSSYAVALAVIVSVPFSGISML